MRVCVKCFTFNQAQFIVNTMDGFTMQQTDFPFVCTIVDDASTDGEQEVICQYLGKNFDLLEAGVAYRRETDYGKILFARHTTNRNCYFAVILLSQNHYSIRKPKNPYITEWMDNAPYIAFCEGDDYWTDPLKLQKQVSFLEAHPDYGMVHCRVKFYEQSKGCFQDLIQGADFKDADQLIVGNTIITLTACIRTKLYNAFHREIPKSPTWKMGDYPLWLYIALKSKVHFMEDIIGVYRILENSASHSTDIRKEMNFIINTSEISSFFAIYAHKEYLLPIIRKRNLIMVCYLYAKNNQRVDPMFWDLVKNYRIYPLKAIVGALLTQCKFGRYLLSKKLCR